MRADDGRDLMSEKGRASAGGMTHGFHRAKLRCGMPSHRDHSSVWKKITKSPQHGRCRQEFRASGSTVAQHAFAAIIRVPWECVPQNECIRGQTKAEQRVPYDARCRLGETMRRFFRPARAAWFDGGENAASIN